MKRTITGWIRKDNLNKPFLVERNSGKISTVASIAKTKIERYYIHESVRVKITVETVEPKKRTPKPCKCACCGSVASVESFVNSGTSDNWFIVGCTKCVSGSLPEPTRKRAIERWNDQQEGKA